MLKIYDGTFWKNFSRIFAKTAMINARQHRQYASTAIAHNLKFSLMKLSN